MPLRIISVTFLKMTPGSLRDCSGSCQLAGLRVISSNTDRQLVGDSTPISKLREQDYGLSVDAVQFSGDSQKPSGREVVSDDMVFTDTIEPTVRCES
jgi:hypothetical protein